MQSRKPSPALVISIIALVAALGGTAVATTAMISSSSQIKNRTIRGVDLRNGTITSKQISKSTLQNVVGSSVEPGNAAIESHRLTGPDMPKGGSATVIELALQPGVYAVFAKSVITPFRSDNGLLELLGRDDRIVAGECNLDVSGTGDFSSEQLAGFGSAGAVTLNAQVTRTLDGPGKATLTCKTSEPVHWQASNSSIIAMRVGSSSRTEVGR